MNSKIFIAIVGVMVIGAVGVVTFNKSPAKPRLGVEQIDQGRTHVAVGQKQNYKTSIPTSGPHTEEAPWGVSNQQLTNESIIHNMEHGGIVVSYRPDIDVATINRLQRLFSKPYAVASFEPTKAIVMPRVGQKTPIVVASWNRLLELNSYDQQTLIDYYLGNVGKSPEPGAS